VVESGNFSLMASVERESSLERPISTKKQAEFDELPPQHQQHMARRPPRSTIRTHHRLQQRMQPEVPPDPSQTIYDYKIKFAKDKKQMFGSFNKVDYIDRISQRPAIISQSHSFRVNSDYRMPPKTRATPAAGTQPSLVAGTSISLGQLS